MSFQVADKPEPIAIDVEEVLAKVKKPSKLKVKAGLATADKNSKSIHTFLNHDSLTNRISFIASSSTWPSVLLFDELVIKTARHWQVRTQRHRCIALHTFGVRFRHPQRPCVDRSQ